MFLEIMGATVNYEELFMVMNDVFFDLKEAMIELQRISICLKEAIFKFPDSGIKKYLLSNIINIFSLNKEEDFYLLRTKVSSIIGMVIWGNLSDGGKVMSLLEEMKAILNRIIEHTKSVKREREY